MKVIDMRNSKENIARSQFGLPAGYQSLSIYGKVEPCEGDLIVVRQPDTPDRHLLFQVVTPPDKIVTNGDGFYWKQALVIDVLYHRLFSEEIKAVLRAHGWV